MPSRAGTFSRWRPPTGAVVAYLAPRLGGAADAPAGAPPAAWQTSPIACARSWRSRAAATPAGVPRHRSAFMRLWVGEPRSVAGGIVDDETYDWFAVVRAMLRTGGFPVVADE